MNQNTPTPTQKPEMELFPPYTTLTSSGCNTPRWRTQLGHWLFARMRLALPNIVLDERTSFEKCFYFLDGHTERFYLKYGTTELYERYQLNGSQLTKNGALFMRDLLEGTAGIHDEPNQLSGITLKISDAFCLCVSPYATHSRLLFDPTCVFEPKASLLIVRPSAALLTAQQQHSDMMECKESVKGDLVIECLTTHQYQQTYGALMSLRGEYTHVVRVTYFDKFIDCLLKQGEVNGLREAFGYQSHQVWKKHCYIFDATLFFNRMLRNG